jgi:hypothetical protein
VTAPSPYYCAVGEDACRACTPRRMPASLRPAVPCLALPDPAAFRPLRSRSDASRRRDGGVLSATTHPHSSLCLGSGASRPLPEPVSPLRPVRCGPCGTAALFHALIVFPLFFYFAFLPRSTGENITSNQPSVQ